MPSVILRLVFCGIKACVTKEGEPGRELTAVFVVVFLFAAFLKKKKFLGGKSIV